MRGIDLTPLVDSFNGVTLLVFIVLGALWLWTLWPDLVEHPDTEELDQ